MRVSGTDARGDADLVRAAQAGDAQALEALVRRSVPLVYNLVGRALGGGQDVDDLVQETMLRVLGALGGLREPERYRSWLVTIALRQVRDRWRSGSAAPEAAADLAALEERRPQAGVRFEEWAIWRLRLGGQRRETAVAAAWLDEQHRHTAALWWLEVAGELTRSEVAGALGVGAAHAAVRVQRMREQLDVCRAVVRALEAHGATAPGDGCDLLGSLVDGWDGVPSALMRKRLARHLRACPSCRRFGEGLVPAEGLLTGLGLVPLPPGLDAHLSGALAGIPTGPGTTTATGSGGHAAGTGRHGADAAVRGARAARRAGRARPSLQALAVKSTVGAAAVAAAAAAVAVALPPRQDLASAHPSAPSPSAAVRSAAAAPVPQPRPQSSAVPTRTSRSQRSAPAMADTGYPVPARPARPTGRTYYVSPGGSDRNPGTSPRAPLRTIQRAADLTAPGDTVSVMNGTYTEAREGLDVVRITRSGGPGRPITYQAYPGHHPVIHPVTGWNGISVSGASYITVRGLDIRGTRASLSLADAERHSVPGRPAFNTNCLSAAKGYRSFPHHLTITGNLVHDCPGAGISVADADHVTIDRNRVHSTSWYTAYGTSGISVLRARDVDRGDPSRYKIRVTRNVSYDNETKVKWDGCHCYSDGNGIIIDTLKDKDGKGPDYRGRVLVAGNVSFDNGGSGIHSFKGIHVDIVNNTAFMNGRSPRMKYYGDIFAANSTDVRLLDNIAYARPGGYVNSKSRNVRVTYDYNVYYNGRRPEVKGPHDIVADPLFARPGTVFGEADFRLRPHSPAVGTGLPFPAAQGSGTARGGRRAPDRGALLSGVPLGGAAGGLPAPVVSGPGGADGPAPGADGPAAGTKGSAAGAAGPKDGTGAGTTARPGSGAVAAPSGKGGATEHAAEAGALPAGQAPADSPADGGRTLAHTGADLAPLGAGAAALVAGGVLFLGARRRRRRS
ncbi:sigma-70 family RNA polymerase sigma factor [Streptomyces sp. NPDC001380]|uniref:sigma-70 family RNA polymerase sigma factor n=1 Tax=Streptomyces sp. NPDC001380 TaxID=3364566 RepID=UPI00369C7F90